MSRLSRRTFLTATASGVGASLLPVESAANEVAHTGGRGMRLSIAAYSFRQYLPQNGKAGEITLEDFFELAAGWGLPAVEPTSYYFTAEDKPYLHRLKAKAFRLGLDISGTAVRNDFCHPDPNVRAREVAHVNTWVDHAVELGAPVIRVFAGNRHRDVSEEQAFRLTIPEMKKACDYAGTRGVFLALENHGYLTGTATELLRFVEEVDHEWFGINLDTGNFVSDPYENMERAAPYALNVQVKTLVVGPDGNERLPADYGRIVDILKRANYHGYLALEYEESEDPYTAVPKHIERLRTAFQ